LNVAYERRGITADTALRFARYFRNAASLWMNLQSRYDLEIAEDEFSKKMSQDVRPRDLATKSRS
jgi:plasmid maintenance system antidote protein VapI